ncbi:alanyl-tRNA editing protein [Candidatus Woesearchaeota archaeon]|nr:alanyl-tRNA editing protein [Candidatus Woesearchaeota archaeon]
MKRALYLDDSYIKEFETRVKTVKDGRFIVLDDTAFYPRSGGQPHDTGRITRKSDGKEFNVVFVGKFDGDISHEVQEPGLQEGDQVICSIDWERRYKLMRMHTSAHILCSVFHNEAGALITGNQLDIDKSRIDFSLEDFDKEKIIEYVNKANEIIQEDVPVEFTYITREEAEKQDGLSKLAKGLPEGIDELRVITIGKYDHQPDGGTHVNSTKEVGRIIFLKADNKGKTNRRAYYTLE